LSLPGVRTGDSGTKRRTSTQITVAAIAGIQNSQRQLRRLTTGPASTTPAPPPVAITAAIAPTAAGTRSGGNSSRMTANVSGKTAAPTPCRTRPAISSQIVGAAAARADPMAMAPSATSRVRSFPAMSPTRPSKGVATEAVSSQAVITQVTVLGEVCRSDWMVGSTGVTRDCSREIDAVAAASTAKMTRGDVVVVRDMEILREGRDALRSADIGGC
jgi:hypothetical protein